MKAFKYQVIEFMLKISRYAIRGLAIIVVTVSMLALLYGVYLIGNNIIQNIKASFDINDAPELQTTPLVNGSHIHPGMNKQDLLASVEIAKKHIKMPATLPDGSTLTDMYVDITAPLKVVYTYKLQHKVDQWTSIYSVDKDPEFSKQTYQRLCTAPEPNLLLAGVEIVQKYYDSTNLPVEEYHFTKKGCE